MPDLIPHSQPPPRFPLLWWRHRHSPLLRPTDRLRAALGLVTAAAVLLTAPALALWTASVAQHRFQQTAHQQARDLHRVAATLLEGSPHHPEPGSDEARHTRYPARVRWTDATGRTRTGTADVPGGLPAGATVDLWTDDTGALTAPPMQPGEIRNRALGWSLGAAVATVLTGFLAYTVGCRRLDRRNLASWDEQWTAVGPRWSSPG
ncbi:MULTISPECIES: hypothetical protein [Streptomyces]|uniref:Proline rich protein membrane protein n=2 Tax=Streptomyces cacaoi TaxID=1898 RepID=A0A4Y3QZL7_STRCI|nr:MULTISPECIES: hypothetical protein [Streptomyces]NNG87708.1 hypothetical protein [Streptomyces cacaoi]QHF96528.1 hypothetical protein DEH18_24790 [Streptomyces sp. NHF165]GEB50087.1 hypothetical protein SCA03_26380 [Streptomyces cacaoi]